MQHGTLASTWVLNIHNHYMSYIVRGADKGSEISGPSKRRWIQGEAATERVNCDDVPVYARKLLQLELESKDIGLTPFLNLLEKLINPGLET
ncbi:6591_t:CDS:2 [Paraglomus occultum]|uniref:6591_t:CDS:1 n=1 Tax=Paraglomus occultum TaxID=144539 RepID=A0A9N9BD75_9GLOM|nr:6591_t:CDS:2 [Paraglomus occultum]